MADFLSFMFLSVLYLAFIALVVYLYIFLIKEIREIAKSSNRNVMMWTIVSIVMSPFVATVIITGFELCRAIRESRQEDLSKKESKVPHMKVGVGESFGEDEHLG